MNASSLIADLSKQDVRLWVRDGQLQYEGPKGAVTDDVLSKLRRNKVGILKYLAERSDVVHGIPIDDLALEAGRDWHHILETPGMLDGYARNIAEKRAVLRGEVPPGFTAQVICIHCGEVWMPEGTPNPINGCRWCLHVRGDKSVTPLPDNPDKEPA